MFHELIKISKDGNAFLEDNTISVLPKMWEVYKTKGMGSDMVKYIVAVYDYESPYRKLPLSSRVKEVTYAIWNKPKHPRQNHQKVKEAINEYKRLQYDPLKAQYMAMTEKAHELSEIFSNIEPTENNFEKLNKYQKMMFESASARDKIKELILKDKNSDSKLFGTDADELSVLEQIQRREEDE